MVGIYNEKIKEAISSSIEVKDKLLVSEECILRISEIIDQIVSVLTNSQQDRRDDITCLGINIKS